MPASTTHKKTLPATAAAAAAAAAAMPPPTASKKRKMDANAQKFYAVRAGVKPGVYLTWIDCKAQISGFKGAQYKSFLNREDALAFVAGKNPPSAADANKPDKFYAVAIGNQPGIYTDWETASKAILGAKGPKYKKFGTMAEAAEFMRTFGAKVPLRAVGDEDEDNDDDEEEEEEIAAPPPAKKRKAAAGAAGGKEPLKIFTDGSSLGNGQNGAVAGVGVWFGKDDPRNISERLRGDPQTNQRAELTAILRALEVVPRTQVVQIFSDSKYAIQCVTEWHINWEKNGWKTRDGPVKNQDLVKAVLTCLTERKRLGTATEFKWVKGHSTDPGNIAADELAVRGAKKR